MRRSSASQPLPWTQSRSGSDHSRPTGTIQLTSTCARPPSARRSPTCRTTASQNESPGRPLSRNRKSVSGEITYGGLETTRSNVSPATGSNRLPWRSSMFSIRLSAALKAAYASARAFTSVATTLSACCARSSAWTPEPVPRSSARPTRSTCGHAGERQRGARDRRRLIGSRGRRAARVSGDEDVLERRDVERRLDAERRGAQDVRVLQPPGLDRCERSGGLVDARRARRGRTA